MAIRYQSASPFTSAGHPLTDKVFLVQTKQLGPKVDTLPAGEKHQVEQASKDHGTNQATPFGTRKTFHFDCGHAKLDGTAFVRWPGTPGGSSGGVGE